MNQLPFSSINYGTCTLSEGQMIIESILKGCIAGTGPLGQTAIFPCWIFKCDKNINLYKGTPNYKLFKLAIKSTSKRFYPNYANNNWSVNEAAIKYDIDLKNRVLADIKENHRDYFDRLVNVFKANIDLMHELRLEMIVTEGYVNDYTIVSDVKFILIVRLAPCVVELIMDTISITKKCSVEILIVL